MSMEVLACNQYQHTSMHNNRISLYLSPARISSMSQENFFSTAKHGKQIFNDTQNNAGLGLHIIIK